ncbi:LysR family transcriptional regulator [Micrococcus terreus]|uniref:LysR family transcriptional regulator n=1 Tax=Micrococcus terreus TaxID=574650 RepID=UPI0033D57F9B
MDTRWLEAFITVAEELHFGRAASRMHMAHSPLSQMIRKLEREVGATLFERSTRSVSLTSAGTAFLPYARDVLERIDSGRQASSSAVGQVIGRVRLGYSGVLNHVVLPRLTRRVHEDLPGVRLELVGRILTDDALIQLRHGALDLAFVGLPVSAQSLTTRMLYREHLGVVVPERHPLAARPSVDVEDLRMERFVATSSAGGSALRAVLMRQCADAGYVPRIVQETADPYVLLQLVAAGVGLTLAPETIAPLIPPGSSYRPLSRPTVDLEHGMAWTFGDVPAPLAAVLKLVDEVLDEQVGLR